MTTQTVRVDSGKATHVYSPKSALMHIIQQNLVEALPKSAMSSARQALPNAPERTLRMFRAYLNEVSVQAEDKPSLNNLIVAVDEQLAAQS